MRKDILCQDIQYVNFKLTTLKPSFLMYPTALFEIGHQFKWKARFIVGAGYIYSLLYNGNKAKTTIRELQKILGTKSVSGIYEFLNTIETFQKFVAEEAGIHEIENFVRFHKGRNGGTNVEIIIPQELAYAYPNNKFFPVPKLAFLLPTSPQAKAIYIYLHYLKNKGSNVVITTASFLEKNLRIDRLSIPEYLSELQDAGVLVVQRIGKGRKRKTKITLKSHKTWTANLFRAIAEEYSLTHPFLKEWIVIEKKVNNDPDSKSNEPKECSNRPHKNVPIDLIKEKECSNRPHKNVPIDLIKETSNSNKLDESSLAKNIESHGINRKPLNKNIENQGFSNNQINKSYEPQGVKISQSSDFYSFENSPTTSITTSKNNTTSIYDDIYNGGGEKFWNLVELLKSLGKTKTNAQSQNKDNDNEKEERKNRLKREENKSKDKAKNKTDSTYKKPDGLKNKNDGQELGKPNVADRVDQEELEKVKKVLKSILPELKKTYPQFFTAENLRVLEELYSALKRFYGEEWLPLAVMYELFNKKAPKYGYARNVNRNYLGLLISFVLKDSPADFWEFYKKFKRVFDLRSMGSGNKVEKERGEEKQKEKQNNQNFQLSIDDLKSFMRDRLNDKKSIYRLFVEEGIRALEKVGSKWIVKCKDSIAKEYVSKNFFDLLREFLKSENIQIEEI